MLVLEHAGARRVEAGAAGLAHALAVVGMDQGQDIDWLSASAGMPTIAFSSGRPDVLARVEIEAVDAELCGLGGKAQKSPSPGPLTIASCSSSISVAVASHASTAPSCHSIEKCNRCHRQPPSGPLRRASTAQSL